MRERREEERKRNLSSRRKFPSREGERERERRAGEEESEDDAGRGTQTLAPDQ